MKKQHWANLGNFIVLSVVAIVLSGCLNEFKPTTPKVVTLTVTSLNYCSAKVGGNLISIGNVNIIAWGVCYSTNPNPVYSIQDSMHNLISFPPGLGPYFETLTGLVENTTYHVRAYANYTTQTSYGSDDIFKTPKLDTNIMFNSSLIYGSVSDREGNIYKTIQIGSNLWMAENLRATKYQDGSSINLWPLSLSSSDTIGIYYDYKLADYDATFGHMYNYYAIVNSRKLCPTGWHISTDSEWTTLESYLGGSNIAGSKLKEAGTSHWQDPNTDATNESGFTALPGGVSFGTCGFTELSNSGYWWSPRDSGYLYRYIKWSGGDVLNSNNNIGCANGYKAQDFCSVRCVKD
jgi:uncharacterized protein (TIGR02145 family)